MPSPVIRTKAPTTKKGSPRGTPAASRTRPRDNTIGATVGRGISTVSTPDGTSDGATFSGWLAIGTYSFLQVSRSLAGKHTLASPQAADPTLTFRFTFPPGRPPRKPPPTQRPRSA